MNNGVSVRLVFDRKNQATKQRKASVFLEITYQNKRKLISTNIKLFSDQWNKNGKVKNHPDEAILNQELIEKVSAVYEFTRDLKGSGRGFSFELLMEHLNKTDVQPESRTSFLDYMEKKIKERKIKESSKAPHYVILRALRDFGKIKMFADITSRNIKKWDEYAKKRCELQSSVYNYHKVLKIYVRAAKCDNLIEQNPYDAIRLNRGQPGDRAYLTMEEIERWANTKIDNSCLERVRDVFLFCCYTGLAYADVSRFDFSKAEYIDGMYRVKGKRQKTGEVYHISIMDKAMNILRKYKFTLPVMTNIKYNEYLKDVAALCGISKRITSHVARHTFATTIAMANKVRIEVISKMLGHTNIKTTQIYAKIYSSEVDNEFNRLNTII